MTQRSEVLILGAGVIGLSSAYFLAKAGREVIVLDRVSQQFLSQLERERSTQMARRQTSLRTTTANSAKADAKSEWKPEWRAPTK